MKSGRERVLAALRFEHPDRTPRDLWAVPYVTLFCKTELDELLREFPVDITAPQSGSAWNEETIRSCEREGTYVDAWGSVWNVVQPGMLGAVTEPALSDWAGLPSFRPPWHTLRDRDLGEINRACEQSDRFVLSDVTARPFERLQFLRGTMNLYLDIGYGTAEFRSLLEMVHEYYLEDIRNWCASDVDGIFFMDDWGGDQRLLIDPMTWREVFKPLYKEYCDTIHASGKYAFFHSDGNIQAIFGELIEAGVDAINSQLFVMDIEELARLYKGEVIFWGEIDRQHVLPLGDREEVVDAVRRVRGALDDGSGGLIAQCEWGMGDPIDNIRTVFEAWLD